jgi:hypothetical protein
MSEQTLLTIKQIEEIPQELLPMLVLSDGLRGFFSWAIKVHEEGAYNHLMWLYKPGLLASQNFTYQSQPVRDYAKGYRLKLWYCKAWTKEQQQSIIKAIEEKLAKPWYRIIYDVPAIIGQAVELPWIQTPGIDICSDSGEYLEVGGDNNYKLFHPDPEQVNRFMNKYPERYEVYGRYLPD